MLFPNHSEDELKRVLVEVRYDLDAAITVILGQDNLANAPSADELMKDPEFTPPTHQAELIGKYGEMLDVLVWVQVGGTISCEFFLFVFLYRLGGYPSW